jgi:hypothetical protein
MGRWRSAKLSAGDAEQALRQIPATALEPDKRFFNRLHNGPVFMGANRLARARSGLGSPQSGFDPVKVLDLPQDPARGFWGLF